MAMIACPLCGKQISDQAPLCPGCGHPVKPPRPCGHSWLLGCGCLLSAFFTFLLMLIIALLFWIGCSLQSPFDEDLDPDSMTSTTAFDEKRYQCQANMEEITLLKEEWATAHAAKSGGIITSSEAEKLFAEVATKLVCPLDPERSLKTSYDVGRLGEPPRCKCAETHNDPDDDEK